MSQDKQEAGTTSVGVLDRLGQYVANALRFWEPSRLYYNLALATVVMCHVFLNPSLDWSRLTPNTFLGFFFLAVLANVVYCAAYVVDLFVQLSGLNEQWKIGRVVLLVIGTLFACVIAHFILTGGFETPANEF